MNAISLEELWSSAEAFDFGHETECLLLPLKAHKSGYVQLSLGGRQVLAHRAIYEYAVGPIEVGMQIDHLCRNRACVNPCHMEQVTPRENTLRGLGPSSENARKSKCDAGHTLPEPKGRARRTCPVCAAERSRAWRATTSGAAWFRAHRMKPEVRKILYAQRSARRANRGYDTEHETVIPLQHTVQPVSGGLTR